MLIGTAKAASGNPIPTSARKSVRLCLYYAAWSRWEAVRQASEARCRRRGGHLQAVTRSNMRFVETSARAAELPDAPSHAPSLHPPADRGDQCNSCPSCRVRDHRAGWTQWCRELLDVVADPSDKRVPEVARACLATLGAQLRTLKAKILEFDRRIMAWHRRRSRVFSLSSFFQAPDLVALAPAELLTPTMIT